MTAPRAGYLIVSGPGDDYVLQELDHGLLLNGQKGRERVYAHAFVAWAPKEGRDSGSDQDVKVVLRPGVAVKGRVVGPDLQPVENAWIFSRFQTISRTFVNRVWSSDHHGTARNGQFELHGLDPDSENSVSFFRANTKTWNHRPIPGQAGWRRAGRRQARAVRDGNGPADRVRW